MVGLLSNHTISLILCGMYVGRQGYDPVELQSEVDHAFANGLFTDIRNSNPKQISLLATGGPYDLVHVVKKLNSLINIFRTRFENIQVEFVAKFLCSSLRQHL